MEDNRLLGDYRLIKQLGQGAMGSVFVAEHRFTKKQYALKVLPEELSNDRAFMQRFEEEISLIALLDHPNIVKVYNVSFSQGLYFLVTDCIVDIVGESTTLGQYFIAREKNLTESELLVIAEQVAAALDYGHGLGNSNKKYIHRGLKLNNILIGEQDESVEKHPRLFISDWGLSKIIGVGNAVTRSFKAMADSLSIQGIGTSKYIQPSPEANKLIPLHQSFLQSFAFLAPEQKQIALPSDEKVDIYAFGVLIYYLLVGEYPEGYFCLPSSKKFDLEYDWDRVIQQCLQPNPEKRPNSLQTLLQEIQVAHQTKEIDFESTYLSLSSPKTALSPYAIAESVAAPQEKAVALLAERVVKEYQPEKRGDGTVQPLLTEMKIIQGGYYFRGANNGCRDEMPRHQVMVNSFVIDIHPVTNEQFVRFLEFLGGEKDSQNHDIIRLKDSRIKKSSGRYSVEPGYGKHPIVGVTWYGAVAYAKWIGKRLPTEVEWEVACCGGLENPSYPTGESIEKSEANFFSSDTTAVMSYPPNGYGLYDMAGNVYEWCQDWYEYTYYDTSAQEPDNPAGPLQGVYRVLRGGCWKSLNEDLRASKRHRNNPGAANGTYGFRCAANA